MVKRDTMQATYDVFGIWESTQRLAEEIDEKPDTVYRWRKKGRIPETHWRAVIAAAAKRGRVLSAEQLLTFNAPMKQRGRPAHDPKPRRRKRSRPESRTAA